MIRQLFTIQDIKEYLEELGFEWKDKIIYDPNTSKYKTATLENFKKNVFLCLKNLINNQDTKLLATINNKTFELMMGANKIDASKGWNDYLLNKITTQTKSPVTIRYIE